MNHFNDYRITIIGYNKDNKELGRSSVVVSATNQTNALWLGKQRLSHPYWSWRNVDHREIQCTRVKE